MRKLAETSGILGSFITPQTIKDRITDTVTNRLSDPTEAKNWGEEVVQSQSAEAPQGVAGQIGKAVSQQLPQSSRLDTIPKVFMGFQQGGFSGGMQNLGSMVSNGIGSLFKSSEDMQLPPQLEQNIGQAFQGSPAARQAADTVAPVVNKTFDHLIDNSMFGSGLKMLASPMKYMSDMAKKYGLPELGGAGGAQAGGTSGATS